MPALLVAVAAVALGCWLSAAVHAVMLIGLRRADLTAGQLMFQGYRFFDAATFKEEARPVHRRFLLSAAGFAGSIVLGAAAGFFMASR